MLQSCFVSTISPARSPIPCNRELLSSQAEEGEDPGTPDDIKQAQRLCGELLWLSQRSRPDLSYPIAAMGSLLTRAAPRCVEVGMRILSYLQRTADYALEIFPQGEAVKGWSDSSFAPTGDKSHSGLLTTWMNVPISWRSCRQPFVSLSTAECELIAALETLTMCLSMRAILEQFGNIPAKTTILVDNQAAVSLANPATSAGGGWRTRHLRIRAAFLTEQIERGLVEVQFVPGSLQLADLLTKSFPRQRLQELVSLWGVVDMSIKAAKLSLARAMVMMMMVQTVRATPPAEKMPLQMDGSIELYIVVMLVGVVLVAVWESLWWIWYRITDDTGTTRRARRLRRLQKAVELELKQQMLRLDESPLEQPSTTTTREVGVQVTPAFIPMRPPEVQIQIREVEVPVPEYYSGPYYVTDGGDHVHVFPDCWGLRNANRIHDKQMCRVCRENRGRSLRQTRSG